MAVRLVLDFSHKVCYTNGEHKKGWGGMISKFGLSGNVRWCGYVSGFRKYRIFANSKIFLFPSRRESFGVALLEAVCSGARAVVYDLPVFRKIYKRGEVSFVPLKNTKDFAEEVVKLMRKGQYPNKKGLELLGSSRYSYQRIAQLEMDSFFSIGGLE